MCGRNSGEAHVAEAERVRGREKRRAGGGGMWQVMQGLLGHGEASGFHSKEVGALEVCVHRKGRA